MECDWGSCDEDAVGVRFSIEENLWLPVCRAHMIGGKDPWGRRFSAWWKWQPGGPPPDGEAA